MDRDESNDSTETAISNSDSSSYGTTTSTSSSEHTGESNYESAMEDQETSGENPITPQVANQGVVVTAGNQPTVPSGSGSAQPTSNTAIGPSPPHIRPCVFCADRDTRCNRCLAIHHGSQDLP